VTDGIMQMLTIALPAMIAWVADPERLGQVCIKTRGAFLAYTRGMLMQAQQALPFSIACSAAKSLPVEQSVGQVTRVSSSHLGVHGSLPRAALRPPSPPPHRPALHNLGTHVQCNAIGELPEGHLLVCDILEGQISIHKRHTHHCLK
jgi:hypothetical protein